MYMTPARDPKLGFEEGQCLAFEEGPCLASEERQSLGGIWEAFGRHLGGWRQRRHPGGIWRADIIKLDSLSNRMQKFL